MNDVAAAAGVGLKTVSRVVNDEPGVAPATALRVREAIAALGFRRNESARLLRQGRTATIGLLLEDIADPFFSVLSRAVEEVARRNGSLLFTGSSGADPERERELALAFCARRVDGLLVVPTGTDHRYLLPELAAGTPTVFVDRPARQQTGDAVLTDTVLTDNVGGARAGTAHLARHGHRRIAFLGDLPQLHTSAERLRGYREALAAAGLPQDPELVALGRTEPEPVADALHRLVGGPDPATALLTGNNRITLGVLRALPRLRQPLALVGFDDLELADLLSPGLTVVAQDPVGLGRIAAELVFGRISGDRRPPRRIELPTVLIPRGSGEIGPSALG